MDFCEWLGIDWSTYPAQRIVAGVCYDGEPVPDTDLGRRLFGFAGAVDAVARSVIVAVCGRRGGKTYTLISLRLLWGMLVRDLSSVAPGQQAVALVVSLNPKLRQESINYALGAARSKPELAAMLMLPKGTKGDDAPSEFRIRRPDGHIVAFEGGVATAGGYGARGRSITDLALDEIAFFRDRSAKVNDKDIFDAGTKAVLPGGQTILGSSPWARRGLLWELFNENFGKPSTALALRAPTVVLNPMMAAKAEQERKRDPDAAKNELDAEFLDSGTNVFFDDELIESMIDDSLNDGRMPQPGELVRAAGDLGFRSDSAAMTIGHMTGPLIVAGEILELRPEPDKPLVPSETVATFRRRMDAHGARYYTQDGYYFEAALEHMTDIQCMQDTHAPHENYVRARMVMRERVGGKSRVRIPRNERLIRQLREVEARPLPGGSMQIIKPRWKTGGHGDVLDTLILMVASLGGETVKAPPPEKGTLEYEAAIRAQRRKEFNQQRQESNRFAKAPWKVR